MRKLKIGPKGGTAPDINVTPLVDVVLVLLIIFMVVTPLVERELKVVTPPTETVDQPQQMPEAQIMIGVKADGTINVNDEVIAEKDLQNRLARMLAAKSDKTLFFNADDKAPYDVAVIALDDAKAAGAKTIGMVTQPLPEAAPAAPGVPGAPAAPGAPPAPGAPAAPPAPPAPGK